jgi:hypothetical protein
MRTRRERRVGLVVVVGLALATVAVASTPGSAATPSGWSAPRPLPGAQDPQSVSCPTTSVCLATDSAGNAFRFDGTSWSGPTPLDPGCAGQHACGLVVSCGAAAFCVAMDLSGQTFTYDGTWSKSTALQGADQFAMFTAVSCPQAGVCVAIDDSGDAFTYQAATWSPRAPTDDASGLTVLSCPTTHFCAAAAAEGSSDFAVRRGTTWRTGPSLPLPAPMGGSEPNDPAAVSCAAATFCAALDTFGHSYTYRGKAWSGPTQLDDNENGGASVSCPTPRFCAAVDEIGNLFHFDGTGWAKQTSLRQRDTSLTSVSCPTTRFCVALDSANAYLVYRAR